MKRIEYGMKATRRENIPRGFLIWTTCPGELNCGPFADEESRKLNKISKSTLGCRGMSCEECWNKEVSQL
ncbi:MAG: hypothetical protein ACRC28_18820 [Clostridium sp.]|uniref:hypothetical protein n=1 Tax=Clostridium sp. TaxID=1506 RepID=UPI003F335E00